MAGKIKRSSFYYTRAVADIRRNQSFQLKYLLGCKHVVIKINMTKMKVKKQKVQKRCMTKRKLKFDDYKSCLETTQLD